MKKSRAEKNPRPWYEQVRRFWWLLFIAWGAAIIWFSLTPSPPVPETGFSGMDKLLHAFAYGLFTLLGAGAFRDVSALRKNRWLWAFLTAVIFGALMELAQGVLTDYRQPEWTDLLANTLGAVLSWGVRSFFLNFAVLFHI